ncbi:hypothetical protein LCGC14_3102550 [marine sediment metagenome]|uniref:Uncharacterized protein n=1 Tax=marine sediment metagenome TaxID=412755 RepID=A0A0F8YEU6_9ZZZZ
MNGHLWKGTFAILTATLIAALWTGNARLAVVETQLTAIDGRLFQLERILLYDKAGP